MLSVKECFIKADTILVSAWIKAASQNITKTCLFKYTENFTTKKGKLSDQKKKIWYFSYFCSKNRLWYLLELPQWGCSNKYPQSMFLSRNKKNNVYPCKPQFYYIKVGFKGVNIIYVCSCYAHSSRQYPFLFCFNIKINIFLILP